MDNVLLQKFSNSPYQSNILLRDGIGYQDVYSSQNYGTFYTIYMKFNCSINKNIVNLTDIKFKIVNYKGTINLGIKTADYHINEKTGEVQFNITVQALRRRKKSKVITCELNLNEIGSSLVINRILIPMKGFKSDRNPNSYNATIFDEEFYYRDGPENPDSRELQGGMNRAEDSEANTLENINPQSPKGWRRCYTIRNRIIL